MYLLIIFQCRCGVFLKIFFLHICSAWWKQTSWTTARTPWRGQSTLLAAPCVRCSDPLIPHISTLSTQDVKLSFSQYSMFCCCWKVGVCKSAFFVFLCVREDVEQSRVVLKPLSVIGWFAKKATEPHFFSWSLHTAVNSKNVSNIYIRTHIYASVWSWCFKNKEYPRY